MGQAFAQTTGNLWVNEFHYDGVSNFGTSDSNEFVELVVHNDILDNPTELEKYQLVMYSAGASVVNEMTMEAVKGLPYDKSSRLYSAADTYHGLSSFDRCPVDGQNYSILYKDMPTLQDLPSAFALIYDNTTVVQLISYEKRFTIKDVTEAGPAAGMMTSLIGNEITPVAESSVSRNENSIQLGRGQTGNNYDNFTWAANNPSSPCMPNNGQDIQDLEPVSVQDALAVELMDLTGQLSDKQIMLNWRTATETNNKGFWVERRTESETDFSAISFVTSKGNSANVQQYEYTDADVVPNEVYYYRLQQLDQSGAKTTSATLAVQSWRTGVVMQTTPNPAKDVVQVQLDNLSQRATLQLTTMTGKILRTIQLPAANTQQYLLDVAQLERGFYLLQVENNDGVFTQKISVL
ncbi:MAG: T9SS type A sorting domain-containing protein [Bacteroidota bacterium]